MRDPWLSGDVIIYLTVIQALPLSRLLFFSLILPFIELFQFVRQFRPVFLDFCLLVFGSCVSRNVFITFLSDNRMISAGFRPDLQARSEMWALYVVTANFASSNRSFNCFTDERRERMRKRKRKKERYKYLFAICPHKFIYLSIWIICVPPIVCVLSGKRGWTISLQRHQVQREGHQTYHTTPQLIRPTISPSFSKTQ